MVRSCDRNPFIAGTGIGHRLDYFHVTHPIFERRMWPIATTCFDGIQEVIFHIPFAGEFFRNFHFLQRAVTPAPSLDHIGGKIINQCSGRAVNFQFIPTGVRVDAAELEHALAKWQSTESASGMMTL